MHGWSRFGPYQCKRDLGTPAIWGPRPKNASDVRTPPTGPISLAEQWSCQRLGVPILGGPNIARTPVRVLVNLVRSWPISWSISWSIGPVRSGPYFSHTKNEHDQRYLDALGWVIQGLEIEWLRFRGRLPCSEYSNKSIVVHANEDDAAMSGAPLVLPRAPSNLCHFESAGLVAVTLMVRYPGPAPGSKMSESNSNRH